MTTDVGKEKRVYAEPSSSILRKSTWKNYDKRKKIQICTNFNFPLSILQLVRDFRLLWLKSNFARILEHMKGAHKVLARISFLVRLHICRVAAAEKKKMKIAFASSLSGEEKIFFQLLTLERVFFGVGKNGETFEQLSAFLIRWKTILKVFSSRQRRTSWFNLEWREKERKNQLFHHLKSNLVWMQF